MEGNFLLILPKHHYLKAWYVPLIYIQHSLSLFSVCLAQDPCPCCISFCGMICGQQWLLCIDGEIFQVENSSDLLERKHKKQYRKKMDSWKKDKLTSCCWSVCPVQRSCNFRAVYRSEATRPYHSRQHSPQQSSHLTDPGLHRQYCALAEHKHIHKDWSRVQRNKY